MKIEIDGISAEVGKETTILEAAQQLGITIPTLCYHQALSPCGACRICLVEVCRGKKSELKTSCNTRVQPEISVKTSSESVLNARKIMAELLLARAPNAEPILDIARTLGIETSRFAPRDSKCILCGLCVRMCEERMGKSAISFAHRGIEREVVAPFSERSEVCQACGACESICPTNVVNLEEITDHKLCPLTSEYNMGLAHRKPVYISYPQAVPNWAAIDKKHCVHFLTGQCGVCKEVCEPEAIDYDMQDERVEIDAGAVILATGCELYDAEQKGEYGYRRFPNVVSGLDYERILSASGPFSGHIKRLSDDKELKRIAFIQCVGSRDQDNPYCSSVCCMYATKQAIVTKEHLPQTECKIFVMDVRAFGKGFDEYYERAKTKYGIQYIYTRPSCIRQDFNTHNLLLEFTEDGRNWGEEEFDLVVLSSGLCADDKSTELAKVCGIELNHYNFAKSADFVPTASSREGIYLAGLFEGPKDIPESVTQASGAAAQAMELLADVRGSQVEDKEYPPEKDISEQEPRVGVFVCHCGSNIGGVIDCEKVADYAAGIKNVVFATDLMYSCSPDGLRTIKEKIEEYNANRVVVASCTPRTHEPLFQETIKEVGLNAYLFEMANIRDQCTWVHARLGDVTEEKAIDLLRMAVGRARTIEPLATTTYVPKRSALVVGGGVAGMTAALSIANQGFKVHLVEKSDQLGGNLSKVKTTAEGLKPPELLKKLQTQVNKSKNITIYKNSVVDECKGFAGNFTSKINCNDSPQPRTVEIEHGAAIIATGTEESKPDEYLYGQSEKVLTQLELEERIEKDPEFVKSLNELVMIQCVGSREPERMVCSRVCCTEAVKNAIAIKRVNPKATIAILYRDIRTYGFKEDYYNEARKLGVLFFRYDLDGKPIVSRDNSGQLEVCVQDLNSSLKLSFSPDILVLSAAMTPSPDNEKVGTAFKVPITLEGFFLEAHMKLRPVDFASDGLFLCGTCHSPKFIDESIAQAQAAAAKAVGIISRKVMEISGVVSVVDPDKCAACLTCLRTCPYDVPAINVEGVAEIEAAMCHGCGICASECPAKAIQLMHYKDSQFIAKTKALFDEAGELVKNE
ncbi:MAG: FAD-dependent oxidoreductase [Planctomycetota bacterium]